MLRQAKLALVLARAHVSIAILFVVAVTLVVVPAQLLAFGVDLLERRSLLNLLGFGVLVLVSCAPVRLPLRPRLLWVVAYARVQLRKKDVVAKVPMEVPWFVEPRR